MKRREFLQTLTGTLALGWLPRLALTQTETSASAAQTTAPASASHPPKLASDRVLLGPKRIEVSRLAMGTGTKGWNKSSNQTRKLGFSGMTDLFKAGFDQGVTFWDGADQYGSHPYMKEALKTIPRDKVQISTKSRATTKEQMRSDLERFRSELGSDYIDIVLLHCVTDGDWNVKYRGAMEALSEAQQKGQVRSVGLSCHTIEALRTAAAEPWVEIDLARINPAQVLMDADKETVVAVLRQMKKAGKGVIGMKIVGEGKLRDRVDESLRYVLSLDCVDAMTIGFENRTELDDMIRRMAKA